MINSQSHHEYVLQMQKFILNKIKEINGHSKINCYDIFLNMNTLRLRTKGKNLMLKLYDSYTFKNSKQVKSKHLIQMLKKIKHPYYMGPSYIVLFSETDAFMYKLGGFETWIESQKD
jgi:hypothetical protein